MILNCGFSCCDYTVNFYIVIKCGHNYSCNILEILTMATESRAAIAKISEHDTIGRLQALSTAALI